MKTRIVMVLLMIVAALTVAACQSPPPEGAAQQASALAAPAATAETATGCPHAGTAACPKVAAGTTDTKAACPDCPCPHKTADCPKADCPYKKDCPLNKGGEGAAAGCPRAGTAACPKSAAGSETAKAACPKAAAGECPHAKAAAQPAGETPAAAGIVPDKVVVYYFHGNFRCKTCTAMENQARAAIEQSFGDQVKNGTVTFRSVNLQDEANRHFAKEYGIMGKALVISALKGGKQVQWKNCDKIWEKIRNPEAYAEYVRTEVKTYLDGV